MNYRKKGQAPEREGFRAALQLTDTNLELAQFSGYASVFGSRIDTYPPTIVDRGAFDKTLKESRSRVRILWAHDPSRPIGRPLEMREDGVGLFLKAQISQTQLGKDVLTLLRDGAIDELSIGFDSIRWEMQPDPLDPTQQIRHLKEVRLWEVSLVCFAADPSAIVAAVHSRRDTVAAMQTTNRKAVLERVRRQLVDMELAAAALGVRAK